MTKGQRELLAKQVAKDQARAKFYREQSFISRHLFGNLVTGSMYQQEAAHFAKQAQRGLTLLVTGQILT